jgi:hypothetical protein
MSFLTQNVDCDPDINHSDYIDPTFLKFLIAFGTSETVNEALEDVFSEDALDAFDPRSILAATNGFDEERALSTFAADAKNMGTDSDVASEPSGGTQKCSSCKHELNKDLDFGLGKKTCTECLEKHKAYEKMKRKQKRSHQDTCISGVRFEPSGVRLFPGLALTKSAKHSLPKPLKRSRSSS